METTPPGWDGEAYFLENLRLIESVIRHVCHRYRIKGEEGRDFAQQVKLKLIDHDYEVLAKCKKREVLRAFLDITVQRWWIDELYAKRGKPRPSSAARLAGPVGVLLERLLYLHGYTFDEACETILTNHTDIHVTREELERIYRTLPPRPPRRSESDDILIDAPEPGPSADEQLIEDEKRAAFERLVRALDEAIASFESDEDRLLLRSIYDSGLSVVDVARMLHIKTKEEQKQLYVKRNTLKNKLRKMLEAQGFDIEQVRKLLDDDRQ